MKKFDEKMWLLRCAQSDDLQSVTHPQIQNIVKSVSTWKMSWCGFDTPEFTRVRRWLWDWIHLGSTSDWALLRRKWDDRLFYKSISTLARQRVLARPLTRPGRKIHSLSSRVSVALAAPKFRDLIHLRSLNCATFGLKPLYREYSWRFFGLKRQYAR
jgi:hypothetical protein